MNAQITEWVCKDTRCARMVGDSKEVIIVDANNPDAAAVFVFPDIDLAKLPNTESSIGESVLIGWPRWFPILFRKRVYRFSYPVKGVK